MLLSNSRSDNDLRLQDLESIWTIHLVQFLYLFGISRRFVSYDILRGELDTP